MQTQFVRIVLVLAGLVEATTGLWAQCAPRSFYAAPHAVHHWLHAAHYPPSQRVPSVGAAVLFALVAVLVLVVPRRRGVPGGDQSRGDQPGGGRWRTTDAAPVEP